MLGCGVGLVAGMVRLSGENCCGRVHRRHDGLSLPARPLHLFLASPPPAPPPPLGACALCQSYCPLAAVVAVVSCSWGWRRRRPLSFFCDGANSVSLLVRELWVCVIGGKKPFIPSVGIVSPYSPLPPFYQHTGGHDRWARRAACLLTGRHTHTHVLLLVLHPSPLVSG